MPKTIQIRNAPSALHSKLKALAVEAGMSLSSYLLQELRKSAEVPTMKEMCARLAKCEPIHTRETTVQIIRRMRGR